MSSASENDDRQLDWLMGPLDAWPSFELVSVIETDDARDRCIVYPRGASEKLATQWITAEEGAFVSVADAR